MPSARFLRSVPAPFVHRSGPFGVCDTFVHGSGPFGMKALHGSWNCMLSICRRPISGGCPVPSALVPGAVGTGIIMVPGAVGTTNMLEMY